MKAYLSPAPSLHLGNVVHVSTMGALPIVKHKAKVLMKSPGGNFALLTKSRLVLKGNLLSAKNGIISFPQARFVVRLDLQFLGKFF